MHSYNIMKETISISNLIAVAQNITINGRYFMISNTGAEPLYIDPKKTATTASFLIPPGTTLPIVFTCMGNLSVISNATGTSVSVMILE